MARKSFGASIERECVNCSARSELSKGRNSFRKRRRRIIFLEEAFYVLLLAMPMFGETSVRLTPLKYDLCQEFRNIVSGDVPRSQGSNFRFQLWDWSNILYWLPHAPSQCRWQILCIEFRNHHIRQEAVVRSEE